MMYEILAIRRGCTDSIKMDPLHARRICDEESTDRQFVVVVPNEMSHA
jgi:hypothetical protein